MNSPTISVWKRPRESCVLSATRAIPGIGCIFIAHNIYHVFQVVDRIVVMRRGKKVADDIDPKPTTIDIEAVERINTGMTLTAS